MAKLGEYTTQQFDISRPPAAPTNANSISNLSSYPSTVSLERKDTLLRLQKFVVQNLYRDIKFIHEQQELDAYDEEHKCYQKGLEGASHITICYEHHIERS